MNKLFAGTKNLILSKQHSLISSTLIISITIILSRLLGLARYRIYNTFFSKNELDILLASFRIPDIVFEILITGALSSVIIPLFVKYHKKSDEFSTLMSSIITSILAILGVFIGLFLIIGDYIIAAITPGFSDAAVRQISYLSKILLVSQLPFLVFSNILTSVGQARKTFILTSAAPIIYNLSVIVCTIVLVPYVHLLAPVLGVGTGAVLMFLTQLPLLKSSKLIFRFGIRMTEGMREFISVVIPRITVVLAAQIDATIDLTLTSLLGPGAYTSFYYAQALQLFPVSFIGISLSQAALPYLSEAYHTNDLIKFRRIVTESILSIFFLTIPIVSFFIFARTPLIRFIFGGQRFDWDITVQTANTLTFFAMAIPAHSIYYIITKCFYSFLDSKTPFVVSFLTTILNTLLSAFFVFVLHLPVWYIAIAFAISITVNVTILAIILSVRIVSFDIVYLVTELLKILISTFVASFWVYWGMKLLDGLILDTSRTVNVFFLLLIGGVSYIMSYLFFAWILEVKEISVLNSFVQKAKQYRRRVIEIYTDIE